MDPGKAGKGTTLPRNEDLHAVAGKVVSLTNAYVLACFLPPKSLFSPSAHRGLRCVAHCFEPRASPNPFLVQHLWSGEGPIMRRRIGSIEIGRPMMPSGKQIVCGSRCFDRIERDTIPMTEAPFNVAGCGRDRSYLNELVVSVASWPMSLH